ncbi:MAG TPA: hypothetical protein VH643_36340 [Gemmataceae bacterium]|jgi:hypothetical protein
MSFGSKLDHFSRECAPGEEVVITVEFVAGNSDEERDLVVFVEEATGVRRLEFQVKTTLAISSP